MFNPLNPMIKLVIKFIFILFSTSTINSYTLQTLFNETLLNEIRIYDIRFLKKG
jgi:hypothetical protein